MKVLLTGATSGLGRNAAQWLLEAGHQVHATGRDAAVGELLRAQGAQFTALDLAQATLAQCEQLMRGCEVVWHCAAKSSPWGRAQDFYHANVGATERLATAAGNCAVRRFIHISTPAIYFDFQHHRQIDEHFRARRSANHYASSKWQAELAIQALCQRYPGTRYTILRPRGLFGPHDRVILPRILSQLDRDKGVLRLPGGGEAMLDLTFVLNVVHAMALASQQPDLPSGAAYNISNHQPQPLKTMLHALLHEQLGLDYQLRAVPYRLLHAVAAGLEALSVMTGKEPALTRYSVAAVYFDMTLSQTRAREELGYQPRYSLQEGIRLTGDWLKRQQVPGHG